MKTPSTALLGAILCPVTTCTAQTRASSTGRNITLLDKLHRKQKAAIRQERLDSIQRAKSNPDLQRTPPRATVISSPTASSPLPSTETTINPSSPSAAAAPTTTTSTLPYTIARTRPGHQLPVYNISKGGGTKHLTRVRKTSGDLNALKADLTKALGLERGMTNPRGEKVEGVSVNWQTNQIVVRGWRTPEIKAWAESRGF